MTANETSRQRAVAGDPVQNIEVVGLAPRQRRRHARRHRAGHLRSQEVAAGGMSHESSVRIDRPVFAAAMKRL